MSQDHDQETAQERAQRICQERREKSEQAWLEAKTAFENSLLGQHIDAWRQNPCLGNLMILALWAFAGIFLLSWGLALLLGLAKALARALGL